MDNHSLQKKLDIDQQFTVLLMQNKLNEAAFFLKKYLKNNPKSAEGISMRGRLLRAHKHVEKGDILIQKAIDQRALELEESEEMDFLTKMLFFSTVIFLGGRADIFVSMGKHQIDVLIENGLKPHHTVLDVGCGCLRAGHLLIDYLEPSNYFGIEPYKLRTDFGLAHVLNPMQRAKSPTIAHHTDFSFSVFEAHFDFVLARSVWTHASQGQIITMLEEFKNTTGPNGIFMTSYVPALSEDQAYKDDGWLGRSEESEQGGYAYHTFSWIRQVAAERGLLAEELKTGILSGQVWIRIAHA